MLMAAVTSTSPGTNTASTWSASFEQTESAGISFAESFDEGSTLAGKTQSHVADRIKVTASVENDGAALNESSSMTTVLTSSESRVGANVADKIQNGTANVKPAVPLGIGMASVSLASKTTSSLPGVVIQHDVKLSEGMDTVIRSEMSDGRPSVVNVGKEKDRTLNLVHGIADGRTLDGIDGTPDFDPKIVTPATPPVMDSGAKLAIAPKSEIPSPGKSQGTGSTTRIIKDHGTSVKAVKDVKAGARTEEKTGMAANIVGTEAQAAATVLAIAIPMGGQQQPGSEAADENLLSPILSGTSGRSVGTTAAANRKNSKETANMEEPDGSNMKASGSFSTESTIPQKTEPDASKTGLVIASNPDGDKTKVQSMAALVTGSGQVPAVSAVSGLIVGNVSGGAQTHDVGANLHPAEATSHAVATVQTGSNSADTTMPADPTHKTLIVTPTSLEVGVSNGTHGWLKIRAEMTDGGEVNTSLSTASSSGQEMLHRELPSLTAYLQSEHVTVNAVVVQPAIASGTELRNSFGGTGGSEQGQAQQSGGQGRDSRQESTNSAPVHTKMGPLYSGLDGAGGNEALSSLTHVGGGSWLNVRA